MLDAPALLLLVVVLVPRERFPALFAVALRRRWWALVVGLLPGLLIGPLYLFLVGLPLVYAVSFLELAERWRRASSARACVRAWLIWGTVWALLTAAAHRQGGGSPGTIAVWLLDAFNRLFFTLIQPLLEATGLQAARDFTLESFVPVLRFIGTYGVGLTFVLNMLLAAVLYEVVRGRAPSLPARLAHLDASLPRLAVLLVAVLAVAREAAGRAGPVDLVWQLVVSFVGLAGLRLLYALAAESSLFRAVFWAAAAVSVLEPLMFVVPVALALLDPFVRLTDLAQRGRVHTRPWSVRVEGALTALRRATTPATVLVAGVLFSLPGQLLRERLTKVPPEPPASEVVGELASSREVVRVAAGGGAFEIDRHPFPNRPGEPPAITPDPDEAEGACRSVGKRLCTANERYWACSNRGQRRYPVEVPPGQTPAGRIAELCNYDSSVLTPLGAEPGCVNDLGVADLAGKVWEWVRVPDRPGVAGLAGSDHRGKDDATTRCAFMVLVADPQLELVNRSAVGFRCCR